MTTFGDPIAIQIFQEFKNKRGIVRKDLHILLGLLERQYLPSLFVVEGVLGFTNLGALINRQLRWCFASN